MALSETKENISTLKIDGISNMLRSKYAILSACWLIAFFACVCVCVWFVVSTVNQFLSHEVTSTTRIFHTQVSPFPGKQ